MGAVIVVKKGQMMSHHGIFSCSDGATSKQIFVLYDFYVSI